MAEYAKKKNDELAAICKERNLPHTGKKADLVKRLEESDAKQAQRAATATAAASAAAVATKPTANEDEIDWDDETATEAAKTATTVPAANAIAAGGRGEVANPQAVPNQPAAIDPAQTSDLTVNPPAGEAGTAEDKEAEKDFSIGLADYTVDEEIEKLKKRCERFGMDPTNNEQIKKLERGKKFGTTALAINAALKDNKQGRREANGGSLAEGGIRKRGRDSYGARRPEANKRQQSNKPRKGGAEEGPPSWMSQKDREAAERRKALFATH